MEMKAGNESALLSTTKIGLRRDIETSMDMKPAAANLANCIILDAVGHLARVMQLR